VPAFRRRKRSWPRATGCSRRIRACAWSAATWGAWKKTWTNRYPNFAVDTAARVVHLMRQPREKVRAFLMRHADRVLYGTDLGMMPGEDEAKVARKLEERYARDWAYFATAQTIEDEGRPIRGLALPEPVLRKLFRENAERWVPGLATAAGTRVR
jgi:predicted TIM-barrel fold metal-dependent hydrolase